MTVAIAFYCSDGVVIGADSMLTPNMGNIAVGHHKGQKVHILTGPQVFAFAGDQGQAARFQIMAEGSHGMIGGVGHTIDYPIALTQSLIQQFHATGIGNSINLNCFLSFHRGSRPELCVFEGLLQPRLMDATHYYAALGSGKLSADPFLRFLVDIFCTNGPPTVKLAVFLTTWAIQHVINTNPGGVAGPIKIGIMQSGPVGEATAHLLSDDEIDDHRQVVDSATDALKAWRASFDVGNNSPEPPIA